MRTSVYVAALLALHLLGRGGPAFGDTDRSAPGVARYGIGDFCPAGSNCPSHTTQDRNARDNRSNNSQNNYLDQLKHQHENSQRQLYGDETYNWMNKQRSD